MNSRGTLIKYLTSGDTLPSSDTVAMTPTVHPAAAGTQRYRESDRPRGAKPDPERGDASVTDREDMPSIREKLAEALSAAATIRHGFRARECPSQCGRPAEVLKGTSGLLN
jgi:phage terminase large subunit GpA-like protein